LTNKRKLRPILLTGSHRSGSTWVGKVLGTSRDLGYIREPFNIEVNPRTTTAPIRYWFTKVDDTNENLFIKGLNDTLHFKYRPLAKIKEVYSIKDLGRFFIHWVKFTRYRTLQKTPLLKDPIALFSTPWLHSKFGLQTIVLIRHPAAFVSSILKAGWHFDFTHFTAQNNLMIELEEYNSKIVDFAEHHKPLIDQAILLWLVFHTYILKLKNKNFSNMTFIRHEDISRNPTLEFKRLFDWLNLEYIEKDILPYITEKNKSLIYNDPNNNLYRNPEENLFSWKDRLKDDEIEYIFNKVKQVSINFYALDE